MLCDKLIINHPFLLQLSCGYASLMNSKQLLKIVTGFARTSLSVQNLLVVNYQ